LLNERLCRAAELNSSTWPYSAGVSVVEGDEGIGRVDLDAVLVGEPRVRVARLHREIALVA